MGKNVNVKQFSLSLPQTYGKKEACCYEKKNKMTSKRSLVISKNETDFSKKIKVENKLISVEAELNKENVEDSENGIPDILITIARKLLELIHSNIDSQRCFKKIEILYCKR